MRTHEATAENSEEYKAYDDVKKNLIDGYGYTTEQIYGLKTISAWGLGQTCQCGKIFIQCRLYYQTGNVGLYK